MWRKRAPSIFNEVFMEISQEISKEPTFQWGVQSLGSDTKTWMFGDTRIEAKIAGDEVWIRHTLLSEKNSELPDSWEKEKSWGRWVLKKASAALSLAPVFPDRSVVVRPENAFTLQPSVEAKIYVQVPLCLKVSVKARKKEQILTEIPSAYLSDTWFGEFNEGELCYAISSKARRAPWEPPQSDKRFFGICPVRIRNNSDEELLVEKICLRVKWLSLFMFKRQIWGSETSIAFRGKNEVTDVRVASGVPPEIKQAKEVAEPRETPKSNFSARTFLSFLTLSMISDEDR